MVPASVGFQCPSCVHEGAKQTKQHKTAYGGTRSANPALTSWVLIGINVAVWLLITATGGAKSDWVLRLSLMGRGLCSGDGGMWTRSEEHTSELQSLMRSSYAVFCLKKNKQ